MNRSRKGERTKKRRNEENEAEEMRAMREADAVVLNPTQHCTPAGDVFEGIEFKTVDGVVHTIQPKWDLIFAHPPCKCGKG